jgi:hypothetical protein
VAAHMAPNHKTQDRPAATLMIIVETAVLLRGLKKRLVRDIMTRQCLIIGRLWSMDTTKRAQLNL